MVNEREIGTFCQQGGIEPMRAPSAKKKKLVEKK